MNQNKLEDIDTFDHRYVAFNLLMANNLRKIRKDMFREFIDAGWIDSKGIISRPIGPGQVTVKRMSVEYVLSFNVDEYAIDGSGEVKFDDSGLFAAIPFASAKDAIDYVAQVERSLNELIQSRS